MLRTVLFGLAVLALTLFVGPLAFVMSQKSKTDPTHLYYVVDWDGRATARALAEFGARQIGPKQPPLAQMIEAFPAAEHGLRNAGYILLPAGALAALCGPNSVPNLSQRNV